MSHWVLKSLKKVSLMGGDWGLTQISPVLPIQDIGATMVREIPCIRDRWLRSPLPMGEGYHLKALSISLEGSELISSIIYFCI